MSLDRKLLDRTRPWRGIEHPQFGPKIIQDGLLFFSDGTRFYPPKEAKTVIPATGVSQPAADPRPTAQAADPAPAPTPSAPPAKNPYLQMQWFKLRVEVKKLGGPDFDKRAPALDWLRANGHIPAA